MSTIVLGAMYALLGTGFIITYKASRILNFAFADIAMFTAYFAVTLVTLIGGSGNLSFILTLFFSFLLGVVIYALLIRPMVGESILATIIVCVGLGIILNAITTIIWGGELQTIRFWWREIYHFPGGFTLDSTEIITVISTTVLFSALGSFYRFTKIGRQMRATAENILLSSQRGMSIFIINGVAWGVGILYTGIAGILFGANYGISSSMPVMALKGIAVALVGGLDSVAGAIPAALIVALSEKLAAYYVNPRLADTVPFIIMLIVLIIRPWGLLGTEEEIERV
jgi:branched-chain amino acid transport system permease protein